MRRASHLAGLGVFCGLVCSAWAQDWTTTGFDAQRSFWLRADTKISVASVRDTGLQHLWRLGLGGEAPPGTALPGPVLLDFLISHRGFRSLAFLGGPDGSVYAFDTDLARLEWHRPLGPLAQPPEGSAPCAAVPTAVTRPTVAAYPSMLAVGGLGPARRSPGVGAVGEPGKGAVTLKRPRRPPFSIPEPPNPGARERPPPFPSLFGLSAVYALPHDGSLYTLLASNGMNHVEMIPFTPAGGHARGLIVSHGMAYVATSSGCAEVPDGVWALEIGSGRVTSWESNDGAVAGDAGPSMAPDGTLYAATTDGQVVALDGQSLEVKDSAHAEGRTFGTSPVVLDIAGRDYLAVAADDGSLTLFDAGDLARGAIAASDPVGGSARLAGGAVAAWRDGEGTTWVLVPIEGAVGADAGFETERPITRGTIAAWRITGDGPTLGLDGGWLSRNLEKPRPPIVVNGVVFATAGGERAPTALYALDGATGAVIWDSGPTLDAGSATGLTAGGNEIFVTTTDGGLHAFGFLIEH
ncbi:MAG: PQQ-binding-like beta-propeller repeat protein [Bryobacterales bacterium]|nr:PQQ-binding-like beta-propeller repeat protein [Bryobacterales bacterium]